MNNFLQSRRILERRTFLSALPILLVLPQVSRGDDLDLKKLFQESIPESPFLDVVYRYANAMLEHGRDTFGPQKTGLLLSALDRKTLKPLDVRPPAPRGVSQESRPGPPGKPLVGSNVQMDQNLLRLFYFLRGMSQQERYTQAADAELKWILSNAQSSKTGLLPWGRYLHWDVISDQIVSTAEVPLHEFSRPWLLWDDCFRLAPDESKRFALGLWTHHVANPSTGELRSAADFAHDSAQPVADSPRQAGFFIRTWAEAFAHTGDKTFLKAIDIVLTNCEKKRSSPGQVTEHNSMTLNTGEGLSLAIDCDGAARKVPEPLRSRLAACAAREDDAFLSLPHELTEGSGFVLVLNRAGAQTSNDYTSRWDPENARYSTAAMGVLCMSRYENTGKIGFRTLILAAADAYRESLPTDDTDAWPLTFGQAITVELAAFRITAKPEYHTRAFKLGEIAIEKFFDDGPLPRASLKTEHYENTTGADTLAMALSELHLSTRTITAVRIPPNTIDR